MDTITKTQNISKVEFVVKENDLLDDILSVGGIEPFDEERYQELNRTGNYNATMLPDASLTLLPEELHRKAHDLAAVNRVSGNCPAIYDDVPGHAVRCALGYGHKGLHIHVGCWDINAIWK